VLVCRVVATATAAAQGEETFTVKQKGTTVQGLPPAPSEASLTTVMPYLWSLASSDTTLRWRLAAALVLLVVSKAAGLAGPVLLKQAMDDLAKPPTLNATPALVALVLAALSKAASAGLNEVRYIIFAPLGQATARRVGVQLLDHILRLDLAFHLERQTGALSRILDRAQRSVVNIFRAVGAYHVLLFSLNFTCMIMLTTTQFWVWKLLIQSVQDVMFLEFST
jgi:ABC-type multidrug transport system fused ATPase/permease subunit